MDKGTGAKILIVDDDKFLLDMYAIKFGEKGFGVDTAFNGSDALAKLSGGDAKPNVVLLDIVMPGLDGFEVLKRVKEEHLAPDTLVIILSNLGQKEDVDKGISLGADGYIVKASSTPTEVVAKTAEILEKRRK